MVNKIAPNFALPDQYGNEFELYKNSDKRILLIFYPKDNSPVCTKQLVNYQLNIDRFERENIRVIGINTDTIESHISFCNSEGLNFPLLSDENEEVSKKYKALNLLRLNKRKLVLVDFDKRIIFSRSVLPFYFLKVSQILKLVKSTKIEKLT